MRFPYNKSDSRLTFPFDLVHSNVWQSPVDSIFGFKYYVIFADDYSRYSWIYLLKFKHKVFEKIVVLKL